MEFSIYRMKQVLKGETGKRVSEDAARSLGEEIDEVGKDISEKALSNASESGRKTVRAEDIIEALRSR